MIKLYTYPASSNSRKVRVVLLEKGLEFERVTIDLSKREQKSPEYLKIHPYGTVPALDDEGFVVYDSTVINEYLEDEYPYPPLMPKDSEGRARARLMEDLRDSHFNPASGQLNRELRKPEAERDPKIIELARAKITECFDRIEKELEGRDYLAGPFSLADIAFIPNIDTLDRIQIQVDPKYKNIHAWIARLKARPSFAASAT
ncbi:MAG TPA: glutathione S-transferase family protein [Candidatus Binatia bacterium]|jgi:glutathione S-transferase|nr:glutathione S-transferase family protein [Candidatus Binatia bacterium]